MQAPVKLDRNDMDAAAKVFPIEMERGETDVSHFLFAKQESA
jgi:hypothetical protein